MPAVPRTASTGAPTATTAGAPVYTDSSPTSVAVPRSSGWIVLSDGSRVFSRTPSSSAQYTGTVAVERAIAMGDTVSRITGTDPAIATQVIREYRSRTGQYPDLSQLGSLGGGYTGGALPPEAEQQPMQLSLFSGGVQTWLILSAVGLVLLIVYGKKGRR